MLDEFAGTMAGKDETIKALQNSLTQFEVSPGC